MVTRIDSPDDYLRVRAQLETVCINSQTHGPIPVPCLTTLLVRPKLVVANNYNPNFVPKDKLALLRQSILDNGFCFPIVTIFDEDSDQFCIVDGFHRSLIGGSEWLNFDYLPVVVLPHGAGKRMTATVQFNKARGVHQVDLDAELIRALLQQGMDEENISLHLGIDLDTIHRYKQITGVAELFKNTDYSMAWEMVEDENET